MLRADELLVEAQTLRPEQTRAAEEAERDPGPQSIQFTPTGASAEGISGTTSNGGKLRVFNGAQNFSPVEGSSYQIQRTSGRVSLVANSLASPPQVDTTGPPPTIIATRSPASTDAGRDGQMWADISPAPVNGNYVAEGWVYAKELGGYAKISGEGGTGGAFTSSNLVPPGGTGIQVSAATDLNGYDDGHQWIHYGLGRTWTLVTVGVDQRQWVSAGSKNFISSPSASYADSLMVGDTLTITKYSWYWDGLDWVKSDCCNGPDDPPPSSICAVGYTWSPDCPPAPDGEACSPSGNFWTCGCPAIGICPP